LFFGGIKSYKSGGDEDKYLEKANSESSAVWGDRRIGDRSDDFVEGRPASVVFR